MGNEEGRKKNMRKTCTKEKDKEGGKVIIRNDCDSQRLWPLSPPIFL